MGIVGKNRRVNNSALALQLTERLVRTKEKKSRAPWAVLSAEQESQHPGGEEDESGMRGKSRIVGSSRLGGVLCLLRRVRRT